MSSNGAGRPSMRAHSPRVPVAAALQPCVARRQFQSGSQCRSAAARAAKPRKGGSGDTESLSDKQKALADNYAAGLELLDTEGAAGEASAAAPASPKAPAAGEASTSGGSADDKELLNKYIAGKRLVDSEGSGAAAAPPPPPPAAPGSSAPNRDLVDPDLAAPVTVEAAATATKAALPPPTVAPPRVGPQRSEPGEDEYKPSAEELKAMLLDSLYGTERGLAASSEVRGEINELITQLEASNPSSDPNDVSRLGATWKLVYTQSPLSSLLALGRLPFVTVGDITQTIDPATGTVINKVVLSNAFSRGAFSSTADFQIRSPKLLSVKFVSNTLATPQLLQGVDLPSSFTIMGQTVDLNPLKNALSPARSGLQSAVGQISSFLEKQPDRSFDIPEQAQAESWLLTTYIDDDVRVARGDGGAVFVLVKEGPAPSAAAVTGYGTYGTGAWKDDPIGNRPPTDPIWTPPSQQGPPPPVTPPALNTAAQQRGSDSVDLNSY